MPWYMAEYRYEGGGSPLVDQAGEGTYGTWLWASTPQQAGKLVKIRGLGEKIIAPAGETRPYTLVSTHLRRRPPELEAAMHGAMYLAMLALQTGAATRMELFGDGGLVHDLAHLIHLGDRQLCDEALNAKFPPHWTPHRLARRFAILERRVPGYREPA